MRTFAVVVLVTAAAAVHADPPAPAATKQLLTHAHTLDMIDPAKGVWLVDLTKAKHVCDPLELLDGATEVDVHAGMYARDAKCQNDTRASHCLLPELDAVDPDASYDLRFDREATGLVLRAIVRQRVGDKTKPFDLRATCEHPAALPKLPPPVTAARRRDEPEGANTPTVATLALLHHVAKGDWDIRAFADREHGLVLVEYPPDGSGLASNNRVARLCGAAIDPQLATLRSLIASHLAMNDTEVQISCYNAAAGATCRLSVIGEWGPVTYLDFRQTDHGLVLAGRSVFDEHQVVRTEWHDIAVAQQHARALAVPCPP